VIAHVESFTAPQSPDRREAFWRNYVVTPTHDEGSGSATAARRATDASRLTFPLQLVIIIVGGVFSLTVAMTGAFWVANSSIRSDVRDILTRMDLRDEKIRDMKDAISKEERDRLLDRYNMETRIKELEARVKETERHIK
jgi:hypothetical protein